MFKNRDEAAKILAKSLKKSEPEADRVVATTPSSLKIAEKISQELGLPLSTMMSGDLKAGDKGPVFGAVSQDGTIWLEDAMIEEFMIQRNQVKDIADRKRRELQEKIGEQGLDHRNTVKSEKVLLVADGISSGMKTAASLGACMKRGADSCKVATPFISQHAKDRISVLADEIHNVRKPTFVASVKDGYVSKHERKTAS